MRSQSGRAVSWCVAVFALLAWAIGYCPAVWASGNIDTKPPIISIRDFFRNPETVYYQLSPSGDKVSFLKSYESRMNLYVQYIGKGEARRLTSVADRDIREYFWKNDRTIIYSKDVGGTENYHLYAVNIETGENRDLTPFEGVNASVADILIDNDNELLIKMNRRNPESFDVYRLRLDDGSMALEVENPGNYTDYLTDHQGVVRMAIGVDLNNGDNQIYYRKGADQPFSMILSFDYRDNVMPYFFDADNKKVYMASNLGRDKLALVCFDPEKVTEEAVLFEQPEVDVGDAVWSNRRKALAGVSYTTDRLHWSFFDASRKRMYDHLQQLLGADQISLVSQNRNEDKFIVIVKSDRNLGTYYYYDVTTDKLTKIADIAPWLNPGDLAVMQPIEYKSRDGYTIHGYLTLPKGQVAKNLPVIINPHGGPMDYRNTWGYNREVQFLANRGYAVLQMNFRGSPGYGKAFLDAGNKQWGKKMQDDITDGVSWLIEQGIADPKRIGIYGASYGGYAVLAGLAFTPDLYACGVDYVGPANLFTLLKTIPPYWKTALKMYYERVGDPERDVQLLREVSPVFHADQIKAPLFVAQGANDPRTNINESNQIVNALRARGVQVQYMVKQNEGHGFLNEENRLDFYQEMEKFLAKYLAPQS